MPNIVKIEILGWREALFPLRALPKSAMTVYTDHFTVEGMLGRHRGLMPHHELQPPGEGRSIRSRVCLEQP